MSIRLHQAVAQVAPIVSAEAPDTADRSTWSIVFSPDATDAERNAALSIVSTIDLDAPTADDVRAEAQRRMVVATGARDAAHMGVLIINAMRDGLSLVRKGENNWDAADASRATQLEAVNAAIDAIRAASNVLEVSLPVDFADDKHWP